MTSNLETPSIQFTDGHSIPQIGYGLWQIPAESAQGVVEAAIETGYRHLDGAAVYGNEVGMGKGIAASGLAREDLFVTTKLWNDKQGKATTRQGLEESLERLGLDYVDLYLIHWPVPSRGLYEETWEVFQELKAEGLTKSIGVANFLPDHLAKLAALGGEMPVINQVELHPTFANGEVAAANEEHDVVTESYSPLGHGEDISSPAVAEIAARLGATPAQVILAWHMAKGYVAIPRSVKPERIAENFGALGVTLDVADVEAIDALDTGNRTNADPAVFDRL